MQFLFSALVMLLASCYVIFLDFLASSSRALEKALVLPVIILLFAVYRLSKSSSGNQLTFYEKLIFLFWGAVCVQLLIVSTGTFYSPFLIFLPLSIIGISFLFTFPVALIFLLFSLIIFFVDIIHHQSIITFFLADPSTITLQILALAAITPIAYILSYKYHVKDFFFSMLRTKVATDETILQSIDELIVVTDTQLRILSINDAVERVLLKSRSELLHQPIFKEFLLKDKTGELLTEQNFFSKNNHLGKSYPDETYTLFRSASSKKEFTIQVKKIRGVDNQVSQISFILRYPQKAVVANDDLTTILEKARLKYEAGNETMKKKLISTKAGSLAKDIFLQEKLESDIYNAHLFFEHTNSINNTYVDLAKLCQQIVELEQDFAKLFSVKLSFEIMNFGTKDISPLVTKNFKVNPEDMTGPFFTILGDVKKIEFTLKKLLDMSIYIASQEKSAVQVSIEQIRKEIILVQVKTKFPRLNIHELHTFFQPYYGKLENKSGLHVGSGLEGFLAEKVSLIMGMPINVSYNQTSSSVLFSLRINKK